MKLSSKSQFTGEAGLKSDGSAKTGSHAPVGKQLLKRLKSEDVNDMKELIKYNNITGCQLAQWTF